VVLLEDNNSTLDGNVLVEHGVSCLLTRERVKQLGLLCLLWVSVCDVDYEDVGQVHTSSDHHEREGVAEASPALTGPLALLPVLIKEDIVCELQIELDNPRDKGAHCGQQSEAIPQI